MRMEITVRQANKSDMDDIWSFIEHAYVEESPELVQFKIPQRWNWQFLDNPFVADKDDAIPIWLAYADGKIVAQIAALPTKLRIGETVYNAGWACDLIVSREFRGLGIAGRLFTAYAENYKVGVHIGMAKSSRNILEKLGSADLTPVDLLWKPMNVCGDFIYRLLEKKTVTRKQFSTLVDILCRILRLNHIFAFAVNVLTTLAIPFTPPRKANPTIEISEFFAFDRDFEEFIERESQEYYAIVDRTPKFLSWKYLRNPMVEYQIFLARREGRISGYIVLRRPHLAELKIGIISDIFTVREDSEVVDALVSRAITYFATDVNVIEIWTSRKFIKKTLHSLGFLTIKKITPNFLCADPALKASIIENRAEWYLTYADHDLDQIHPIGMR